MNKTNKEKLSLDVNANEYIPKRNSNQKINNKKDIDNYSGNNNNNNNKKQPYRNKNGRKNEQNQFKYGNGNTQNIQSRNNNYRKKPSSHTNTIEVECPRNKRGEVELTHLVSFSFPPRQTSTTVHHHRKRKVAVEPFNKQRFINANYQFIVKNDENFSTYLSNPDIFLDWNKIQQVIIPTSEIPSCPICLSKPIVGKVTECGHAFCYPCILHYLKLNSKEKYKTCPLCQDIIHERNLKYVRFRKIEKIEVDSSKKIELVLMKRKINSSLAIPKNNNSSLTKPPKPTQNDLLPFSKIFAASSNYIKNEIILPAYYTLQEYLHEVDLEEQAAKISGMIIISETPYIKMALEKVTEELKTYPDIKTEKALEYLTLEEKAKIFEVSSPTPTYASKIQSSKEKIDDHELSPKKPEVKQWIKEMEYESKKYQQEKIKEGGFEPAFSDDDDNDDFNEEGGDGIGKSKKMTLSSKKEQKNNNKYTQKVNEYIFGNVLLDNYSQCETLVDEVEEEEKDSIPSEYEKEVHQGTKGGKTRSKGQGERLVHDSGSEKENDGKSVVVKKTSNSAMSTTTTNESTDEMFYFYQASDGQHYYLHPLCNKVLKYEYGDYANFPEVIHCNLLSVEESTVNEEMRKRFKYLSHLPLSCDIVLCEVYLSEIVSPKTMKQFKNELSQLSKKRRQKAKKENNGKAKENLKESWKNMYKSITNDNQNSPLLIDPIDLPASYNARKSNNSQSSSQENLPQALSQEAIDFLKTQQKKQASTSFAKIASASNSSSTSAWGGWGSSSGSSGSGLRKTRKNYMVDGDECLVNKNDGWSLDFDHIVEESGGGRQKKNKEVSLKDFLHPKKTTTPPTPIPTTSTNTNTNTTTTTPNTTTAPSLSTDPSEKEENYENSTNTTTATSGPSVHQTQVKVNSKDIPEATTPNPNQEGQDEEAKTDSQAKATPSTTRINKKKSKKVIMISNGGQRRRN